MSDAEFKRLKSKAKRLVRGGRSNRRIYGGIYEVSGGRQIYIAYRKRKEIFRSGEKCVSDAVDKGIACWAMEYDTLLDLRREMVFLIGIYDRDSGDMYLTSYESFADERKTSIRNYESRGGAQNKYLPLQYFAKSKVSAIA